MAEQKKEKVEYRSPEGIVKWASVMEPQTSIKSEGVTKPVEPNYNITLLFNPNDAAVATLIAKIQALHAEAFAKASLEKKKLIDTGLDNCFFNDQNKEGVPTGKVAFKFKSKVGGKRSDNTTFTYPRPPVVDAYGSHLPKGTIVFGGSVAQVNFSIKHTAMQTGMFYTSLSLNGTMVITLKSAYERDASTLGFTYQTREAEEGQNEYGEQTPEAAAAQAVASNVGAPQDF